MQQKGGGQRQQMLRGQPQACHLGGEPCARPVHVTTIVGPFSWRWLRVLPVGSMTSAVYREMESVEGTLPPRACQHDIWRKRLKFRTG